MNRLIAATAACLILSGCEPGPEIKKDASKDVTMPGGNTIRIYTLVLDGNEYYATHVRDGWCLCPKLPKKIETPEKP